MLAYLISAYTDPDHLARLIAALDHEADFYVHVDANVDDASDVCCLRRYTLCHVTT